MIVKLQRCPNCSSENIVKNGHTTYGAQRCLCHDCGKTRVIERKIKVDHTELIRRSFIERLSLRGICRVFRISFCTLYFLLLQQTQSLPSFRRSVVPAKAGDILEFDELYSFVGHKKNKRWLWVALNRSNRQVVAFVIGDRSTQTFKRLIRKIPMEYLVCQSYSDLWKSYRILQAKGNHKLVTKDTGQTNHIERWNCTLRQRVSRYVRKSLAFSKIDKFHHLMTKLFIYEYNLNVINT